MIDRARIAHINVNNVVETFYLSFAHRIRTLLTRMSQVSRQPDSLFSRIKAGDSPNVRTRGIR